MSAREITKALAGQEDILFGQSTTNQTRNGTVYPITRIDKIHPVATRAALKLLDVSNPNLYFNTVLLLGLVSLGAGGGIFCHSSTLPKTRADDLDIIVDSAVGDGCWVRLIPNSVSGMYLQGTEVGAWLADTTAETVVAAELVTNGDFPTDTSGWTAGNGATLASVAGELRITANGTSNPIAFSNITCVVGKRYVISATARRGTCVNPVQIDISGVAGSGATTSSTTNVTIYTDFIATLTTHIITAYIVGTTTLGETAYFDNISCIIADEDLSATDQALTCVGTIIKSAVNTGADLMGYSNWATNNYWYRQYGADLDITDEITVAAWVYPTVFGSTIGVCGNFNNLAGDVGGYLLQINSAGLPGFFVNSNADVFVGAIAVAAIELNKWTTLVGTMTTAGVLSLYANGVLIATNTGGSIGATAQTFKVGIRMENGALIYPFIGSIAGVRVINGVLTAAQIMETYQREKAQFLYVL